MECDCDETKCPRCNGSLLNGRRHRRTANAGAACEIRKAPTSARQFEAKSLGVNDDHGVDKFVHMT